MEPPGWAESAHAQHGRSEILDADISRLIPSEFKRSPIALDRGTGSRSDQAQQGLQPVVCRGAPVSDCVLKKCDEGFHALLVSLIVAQSLLQAINDSLPCR
mmetsp:Transcript_20885/g.57496  ORF Transcript_20885/g.57496 Transcript_20885/m.57496 type:complete len:101 (-) Transcript_20885:13-315(-)